MVTTSFPAGSHAERPLQGGHLVTVTARFNVTDVNLASFDLYRDIHKGIRADLFAVTSEAGNVDPHDWDGAVDLAAHVGRTVELLASHAEHEDRAVLPAIEEHLPALAVRISTDHASLETRMETLNALAGAVVETPGERRRRPVQWLYLELASFTGTYLAHQDVEERAVMPALERALGLDAVLGIHHEIVSNIPPDEMAKTLALMLPAMNVDDRVELLAGLRATAPAPVFEGVFGLAASVLTPADHAAVAAGLGIA